MLVSWRRGEKNPVRAHTQTNSVGPYVIRECLKKTLFQWVRMLVVIGKVYGYFSKAPFSIFFVGKFKQEKCLRRNKNIADCLGIHITLKKGNPSIAANLNTKTDFPPRSQWVTDMLKCYTWAFARPGTNTCLFWICAFGNSNRCVVALYLQSVWFCK